MHHLLNIFTLYLNCIYKLVPFRIFAVYNKLSQLYVLEIGDKFNY